MKNNLLRLFHIPTITLFVTMVVWMFRYIWFTVETVPMDRMFILILALVIFGIISGLVEGYINDWLK